MINDVLLNGHVESFEQRAATRETLLEINLPAHGRERDGFYFVANACTHRQLINHLRLDEGRVHIDADETPVAAEHIVFLERDINSFFAGNLKQFALQRLAVG